MKLLKFLEKILPLAFWLILIFAFDTPRLALLTLIAAVIHEAGHVMFGAFRGIMRLFPSPHPTGFRIKTSGILSYKDEIILLIGGPVSNLCFFMLGLCVFGLSGCSLFFDFAFLNFLTAFANLLPIKGYDGYRIIESVILLHDNGSFLSLKLLFWLSFLFTVILTFLSLYLLLKLGEGYWIFAIFFSSVLIDIKKLTERGIF